MKKRWALLAAAVPAAAVWDVYKYVFARRRPPLLKALLDKKMHEPEYYLWRDERADALRRRVRLCFTISSERGEALEGFYFPCGRKFSDKIAFIVHGYHSEHAETAGMLLEFYHSRGFDVFAPDNTASGFSGGSRFGYGVFESADCLKWLDFLTEEFGGKIRVVMHGFSLGGAAVMQMCARVPDCVRFAVEDSGFIDARPILKSQLGPLYGPAAAINRLSAGYSLDDTDAARQLAQARVPMLFVHGTEDPTVPFENAELAFGACCGEKALLVSQGARHIETMFANGAEYEKALDEFIGKYID